MNQKISAQEMLSKAREIAMNSPARQNLLRLFDQGTFVETGVYVTRHGYQSNMNLEESLEGVVTGYGAVNGALVYAFAHDASRMHGAIVENHAKKLESLYHLALSNGAPIVGIFNCCGASVFEGVSAMAAYGRILSSVTEASGAIPQIAIVDGPATGTLSAIVSMFDFILETEKSELYVAAPAFNGKNEGALLSSLNADLDACIGYAKLLVEKLPPVCDASAFCEQTADDPNRVVDVECYNQGMKYLISSLLDSGSYLEVNASKNCNAVTALGVLGGVPCAVVGTDSSVDDGKLSAFDCKKISRFVRFCNAFDIPVITLVDSKGIANDSANVDVSLSSELARLAQAYASADIPLTTVYVGNAIGASYILLGSKAVGADITYALPSAIIGLIPTESAVAFVQNDEVTSSEKRAELEENWNNEIASPLAAAAYGEVDDIISPEELRARLCSSLYMMRGEGPSDKVGAIDTL